MKALDEGKVKTRSKSIGTNLHYEGNRPLAVWGRFLQGTISPAFALTVHAFTALTDMLK